QSLEHHHRADKDRRDRGTALLRWEQVGKVLVAEQLVSVIGQERVDRVILDEAPAEGRGVEELTIGTRFSLHRPILLCGRGNREHPPGGRLKQQPPSSPKRSKSSISSAV